MTEKSPFNPKSPPRDQRGLPALEKFHRRFMALSFLQILLIALSWAAGIPPAMSAALARRFPDARRVLLPGTHHNDVFARSMIELVDALRRFAPP